MEIKAHLKYKFNKMRNGEENVKNQLIPNLSYTCHQIKLMSSSNPFNNIFKTDKVSVLETISNWKEFEEDKRKKKDQVIVKKSPKAFVNTVTLFEHILDPKQYELDKKKEKERQEQIEKEKQLQIQIQQQALLEKKRLEEQTIEAAKAPTDISNELPNQSYENNELLEITKELTKEEIVKFNLSTGKDEDIFCHNIDDYDDDENNFINDNTHELKEPANLTPAYASPKKLSSSEVLKIDLNISKLNSSASLAKPQETVVVQAILKQTPPRIIIKEAKEIKDIREHKEIKEIKDNKEYRDSRIIKESREPKESNHPSTNQIKYISKVYEQSSIHNIPPAKETSSKFNICLVENPSPPKHSSSNVIKISNISNNNDEMPVISNKHISNFVNKENIKQRTSKIILEDDEEESLHKDDKRENDEKSMCEMANTKIRILLGPNMHNNENLQDDSLLRKKIKKENATPISISSRSDGQSFKNKHDLSNDSHAPLKEKEVSIVNSRKLTTNSKLETKPINNLTQSSNNIAREITSSHTTTSFTKLPPLPDLKKKDPTLMLAQKLEVAVNEVKQKIIGFSLEDVDLDNFNKSLTDIYDKINKLPEVRIIKYNFIVR